MSVRLPAGEMRHVLKIMEHKIESNTTAYDTYGMVSASSTAWHYVSTVRGNIKELSGAKESISRQKYPTASHMVTIDYNSILASTGGTRRAFLFGTRWMFMSAILNPDQENRQMQVVCSETI